MNTAHAPLTALRVIDFTMGWAGPLATRQLADLGAEVIKVESKTKPDWWRGVEISPDSMARGDHERNPPFNHINRNKLGVAIDLVRPEGRALALDLVACADVVIENQATGVMAKLGLSYEDLAAVNSSIIMVSLPGYGCYGPWSDYRGYGSTFEQGAGLPHLTGMPEGPPLQSHIAYGDACGGLFSAAAVLVAVHHQRRTGEGQRVDLSQVETMMQLGAHGAVHFGLNKEAPVRTGNRHPQYVPHGCFPTEGHDHWLVIAVTEDEMWPPLAHMIERDDLGEDPELFTASGRRAREAEIEQAISHWTRDRPTRATVEALQSAGISAGIVARPRELLDDPILASRGFWKVVDRAYVGPKPHPLTPFRINGERGTINWPAPLLGEHTEQVLRDVLGLSETKIKLLREAAVVAVAPPPPTAERD